MDKNMSNLPVSILEFKSIDPVKVGEEWAIDVVPNPPRVVEIYIDDREMMDIIAVIEKPYKEQEGMDNVDDYGHVPASSLYGDLSTAMDKGSYSYNHGVYLFCCRDCGEPGCWSVTCKVTEDEDYVYWTDFEQEHRDWEYNLQYKFEKGQYYEALGKLKRMADSQKKK
jgi:hypothetical protein